MKKKLLRIFCFLLMMVCYMPDIQAQYPFNFWGQGTSTKFTITVNPASIIKVVPTSIQLNLTPVVAGGPVVNDVNSSSYLRVTSISSNSNSKTIQVQITAGSVPTGTNLKLTATKCTTGSGNFGNAYAVTLSSSPQKIVDGVSSCYTGDGPNEGYNLTYRWGLNTGTVVTSLPVATAAVVITYTISQW